MFPRHDKSVAELIFVHITVFIDDVIKLTMKDPHVKLQSPKACKVLDVCFINGSYPPLLTRGYGKERKKVQSFNTNNHLPISVEGKRNKIFQKMCDERCCSYHQKSIT